MPKITNQLKATIVTSLFSLAFLAGCNQQQNTQTAIDGLFSIKLGKPLPPSCTNSDSFVGKPDEWGFYLIDVIPPQTNSAFDSYQVILTPTNQLVCAIWGKNYRADSGTFSGLLRVLRNRYGNKSPVAMGNTAEMYSWSDGSHDLTLTHFISPESFWLICEDTSLSYHPAHVADTNGL